MLISVIIPVYNVERYLPECLDSVLAQTMTDFEVLLVDDGSPDRAGEICDAYAARDPRIRVFHTPNRGVCAARNLALDHAEGRYVYFIDSDDSIHPGRLQQLLDGMTDDGISFGGGTETYPDGRRIDFPMPRLKAGGSYDACVPLLTELIRRDCFGWVWCKLFSRAIIERHRIRFAKEHLPWDDEIFTAEYCRHITRISTDSRPYYYYRYLPETLSRSKEEPLHLCRRLSNNLRCYQAAGYTGEILYQRSLRALAMIRRTIRRAEGDMADWDSAATREAVRCLREAWETYRKTFRRSYLRTPKDLQYATIGRLVLTPKSDRWLRWMIRGLHL